MRYQPIDSYFFKKNRKNFAEKMKNDSIAIFFSSDEFPKNGDQFFKFRQNSSTFYLSGIDQSNTILIIKKQKDVYRESLFIKSISEKERIWNGEVLTKDIASDLSAIDDIHDSQSFIATVYPMIKKSKFVYLWENSYKNFSTPVEFNEKRQNEKIKRQFDDKTFLKSSEIIDSLRIIKSDEELKQIKKAVTITGKAYLNILKKLKPGIFEYEIEAEMTYEFLKNGAYGHAYDPIVASGKNACFLHYTDNENKCKDGDLLLMDFGAEYGNYAADCSRTIPVNGKYSKRQKEVYIAVLDVYKKAQALFTPGNTIKAVNNKVGEWMQEKLLNLGLISQQEIDNQSDDATAYKKYFMHGTSHFLGLDVHDVGTTETLFEKGMVLTCEPGIYIPEENIGVRIETDIIVDDTPIDLMADFPVEVDEIEDCMV